MFPFQKPIYPYPALLYFQGLLSIYYPGFFFSYVSPSILLDAFLTSSNTVLCFVCLFIADCCQAKDQYIEQFKDTLSTSVAKSIAGFFAEPIQVSVLTLNIN